MKIFQATLMALLIALCQGKKNDFTEEHPLDYVEKAADLDMETKEGLDALEMGRQSLWHLLNNKALSDRDPMKFPFWPMFFSETVSLCLNDLELGGFGDVTPRVPRPNSTHVTENIYADTLYLHSEHYIAGGNIGTMPFVGESRFTIDIMNPELQLTYQRTSRNSFCVVENSTEFIVTIDDLIVHFEDINPTKDSAIVINSVLSSFTTDVERWMTEKMNGDWHQTLDKIVMDTVSGLDITDCSTAPTKIELPRLFNMDEKAPLKDIVEAMNEFTAIIWELVEGEKMLANIASKFP